MSFGMLTRMGQRNHALDLESRQSPRGKGIYTFQEVNIEIVLHAAEQHPYWPPNGRPFGVVVASLITSAKLLYRVTVSGPVSTAMGDCLRTVTPHLGM